MKHAIKIRNKFTGTETFLGLTYATQKEAEQYIDSEVCKRCNAPSVIPVPDSWTHPLSRPLT